MLCVLMCMTLTIMMYVDNIEQFTQVCDSMDIKLYIFYCV